MARGFRIHSNAVFNPFSYQELVAPLAEYEQAYAQMQENLLAAGEEANQWKRYIDNDPWAKDVLQGYNTALQNATEKLNSEGLKGTNRNTLLQLRRQYNDQVKPVNDAAKTLAGIEDMYRQAYAKDPTMMRGIMPSIKNLIDDPGAMPHMVSGSSLYNQGAQAAKAASLRKQDFKVRLNGLVRGYIDTVQRTGYNSEEAQRFLDAASRQEELQTIVNQIYGANRVDALTDPQQGMDWIIRGVFDGLAYEQKNDLKYDQYAAEMRAAERAATKAGNGTDKTGSPYVVRHPIVAQRGLSKDARDIEKYLEYFDYDSNTGKFSINDKGKRAYEGKNLGTMSGGIYQIDPNPNNSTFKRFVDNISQRTGGGGGRGNTYDAIGDAFTSYYMQNQDALKNATQFMEYRFNISSTEKQVLEDFLKVNEDKLHIMRRNDDGKLVVDKDKKPEDIIDKDFGVARLFIQPNGNLYAQTTAGIIELPKLDYDAQMNINSARNNMTAYEEGIAEYMNTLKKAGYIQDAGFNEYSINEAIMSLIEKGKTDAAMRLSSMYQDYINSEDSMGYYVADMVRTLGAKEAQF